MTPQEGGPPRVTDALLQPTQPVGGGQLGLARARVRNYLDAAYAMGDEAGEQHRRTLAELRKEPAAAIVELARALGEVDVHDFPARWALVYAAGALRHRAALPLLAGIVDTPIPPEPEPPAHGLGTTAHEIILRTTAVEGIGTLAAAGDKSALDALLRFVAHSIFSIRRAAVQAILSAKPSASVRARVRATLPPDQQFLLKLKAVGPSDMEQPDPRRHLREDRVDRVAPPDPGQSVQQLREPPGRIESEQEDER